MSYLNTSMTKRADLGAKLFGAAAALGIIGGGVAGHYGSHKPNNTPATVLGTIGGGVGATAGLVGSALSFGDLPKMVKRTRKRALWLSLADKYERMIAEDPNKIAPDHQRLMRKKTRLSRQYAKTPKWIKYFAKHRPLFGILGLSTVGLGTAAGGALGAKLGIMGGDALA